MAAGSIVCIDDFEAHAAKVLPALTFEYFKGGADEEQSLKDNRDAFKRFLFFIFSRFIILFKMGLVYAKSKAMLLVGLFLRNAVRFI